MRTLNDWLSENGQAGPGPFEVTVDVREVGHRISGKAVVSQAQLDLFAAALRTACAVSEGEARENLLGLLEHFEQAFPGAQPQVYTEI